MRVDEGNLQPGHEGVDIVAGIADQRDTLLVAGKVAAIDAEEQFRRIRQIVEIGRADRAAAVERLEIRARRADVAQGIDVGMRS